MKYRLTRHALERMDERSISISELERALANPDQIWYDEEGKVEIKKVLSKQGKDYLLLIVGVPTADYLKIVTIIQTSKIKKYL